jgi:hypothetical protein
LLPLEPNYTIMPRASDNVLANAFEYQMRKEPSEWASTNWDYSECGTSQPTPCDDHATLWMICNHKETIYEDIEDFFQMGGAKFSNIQLERQGGDQLTISKDSQVLLQGSMHGDQQQDANVGRYAMFQASTETGCALIILIRSCSSWGYMTFLFHDRVEREIELEASGYYKKVIVTTGLGPSNSDDKNRLSTRFELMIEDTIAAQCHLSYRDGSWDASMGPTIEMMTVRQDFRGQDLLPLLWFWVRTFIQDNFPIECLNKEAPVGHVMIKATQLTNTEIEIRDGKSMTDKDFFYNHAGFSVRKELGVMFSMMASRRPLDEEAVLYIPLLTPQQVRERAEQRGLGEDTSCSKWTGKKGARNCPKCQRIGTGLLRCTRCGDVYYCNRNCQKKDWKQHKRWCGKTRDQVHEELVQDRRRIQNVDGSWSTVLG